MNEQAKELLQTLKAMPLSRKLSMGFIIGLVIAGLAIMFYLANASEYRVLFSGLTPEDGSAIIAKLKEKKIPYKVEAGGSVLMVPEEIVHETRLALAGENLPSGGGVGFEIFDRSDFRTSQFVQELNYRRALQGELARTIDRFEEVKRSRVFIVIPKETLFVEDKKPASASIQLELKRNLPKEKLTAIVHLVANAVEGLEPEQITVVDTKGRLIFKGREEMDPAIGLSGSQVEYKLKLEERIRKNVQSMLEKIVGPGKAIVRVTADIDFDRVTISREEYDPSVTAIRSSRNVEENYRSGGNESGKSSAGRTGIVSAGSLESKSRFKRDLSTNYEINKVVKTVVRPAGKLKRLSVAAVIDGRYRIVRKENGATEKVFVPRSGAEIQSFTEIVKKAMGFSEDREDQVSVKSIPFAGFGPEEALEQPPSGWTDRLMPLFQYKRYVLNLLLVLLVFFMVVRPLVKIFKKPEASEKEPGPVEVAAEEEPIRQISQDREAQQREYVQNLVKSNPEKTLQLIQGWLGE